MISLAFRPFLEPLPIENVWYLLAVPLVIGVAVIYKTLKLDDLASLPREALILGGQVLIFMGLIAGFLSLLTLLF